MIESAVSVSVPRPFVIGGHESSLCLRCRKSSSADKRKCLHCDKRVSGWAEIYGHFTLPFMNHSNVWDELHAKKIFFEVGLLWTLLRMLKLIRASAQLIATLFVSPPFRFSLIRQLTFIFNWAQTVSMCAIEKTIPRYSWTLEALTTCMSCRSDSIEY